MLRIACVGKVCAIPLRPGYHALYLHSLALRSDYRSYPYRLRSLRSLRAALARDGCQVRVHRFGSRAESTPPKGSVQVERNTGQPT